ncbi:methyltransferase domain-containing protein, partial [Candidatus Pacearchaeota archaeon]|nr:methyltransferase domain-containing protein [Candidatus Pacearchaeota archaeon]
GLDKRDECVASLEEFDIKSCDIESAPFPYEDDYFDFIFSKSVLEHVVNVDNFLSQSYRVLKPGGIAVLMTPDWKSQHDFFWDDYTHVKAFTRKSLQNAMVMHGYDNVNSSYFLQLPIVWKYPVMKYAARLIALLPDSLKWKDREQREFRPLIRFSKEKMLLAYGVKSNA